MHDCTTKQLRRSPMNENPEAIRAEVAKAYAQRVTAPAGGGCCGPSPTVADASAALAGYSPAELGQVPEDAAEHSFGCGNPVALAELGAGEVVLDLGSGAGIDLFLASDKVGPTGRVIGVDMTDEMVARAADNARRGGYANVEVRKGIIEQLPVESGSVDWVISNCVINLSPEKPRVFREIARVLKPGGRMLVSDIVAQELPKELRSLSELYVACVAGAVSEEQYLAGLREVGLVDVAVRGRIVYDADQLAALAEDVVGSPQPGACGCTANLGPKLQEHARALQGKIWSAKIYARKPL
jgi:SAM-dependent methyltransferase